MRLEDLKPKTRKIDRKRIGRGGKRGTYSGKGLKGQSSRAGTKFEPEVRYLIKRYPKLRGYRYRAQVNNIAIINVSSLENKFNAGDIVNPEALVRLKLVNKYNGKIPKVKILGSGEITKALTVTRCLYSKSAEKKITASGGSVKIMPSFKKKLKIQKKVKSPVKKEEAEATIKKPAIKKISAKKPNAKKSATKDGVVKNKPSAKNKK